MDASPLLARIAALLEKHGLQCVLIGNAAAALQGAPVTTIDFDFMFRRSPANIRKLKAVARDLDATLLRPFYPQSGLIRLARDGDGLQVDFMSVIDGIHSFEGLRKRAGRVNVGGIDVLVATLPDIVKSKKAAGRPQDLAVLAALEKTVEEAARKQKSQAGSSQEGE